MTRTHAGEGKWSGHGALFLRAVLLFLLAGAGLRAMALEAMSDNDMSGVSGSGLAFVMENIAAQMAPTSYIEEIGSNPCYAGGCTVSTQSTTMQRGDLYWFGWSITSDTGGQSWYSVTNNLASADCSTANAASGLLGCPIGGTSNSAPGQIGNLAPFDNPYVMRVFQYTGYTANNATTTAANNMLEILGPSCVSPSATAGAAPTAGCSGLPSEAYRWSFWGDIVVSQINAAGSTWTQTNGQLKNLTMIEGLPASYLYPISVATTTGCASSCLVQNLPNMYQGSVLRMFQTLSDNNANTSATDLVDNQTFGIIFNDTLSGNFRFAVNQNSATDADTTSSTTYSGVSYAQVNSAVPEFDSQEGMYFRNVQTFLPLGQVNYQSVVLNSVGTAASHAAAGSGNFTIELTRLPKTTTCTLIPVGCAYAQFYSLENTGTASSAATRGPAAEAYACANATYQCGYYTAYDAQTSVAADSTSNWENVPYGYWISHGYVEYGTGTTMNHTQTLGASSSCTGTCPTITVTLNDLGVTSDSGTGLNAGVGGAAGDCSTTTAKCSNVGDGIYFVTGGGNNSSANHDTFTAAATNTWDPYVTHTSYSTTIGTTTTVGVVNLGTSYIEGIALNHLKITTLGGN